MPGRRVAAVGGTGAGGTAAASVAGSEARGGVREDVRFPGGRPQSGRERRTGRAARPRVCERMISNESRVREIRTLGSMSGERKRSRSGVRGTGGMAPESVLPPPLDRRALSSTLLPIRLDLNGTCGPMPYMAGFGGIRCVRQAASVCPGVRRLLRVSVSHTGAARHCDAPPATDWCLLTLLCDRAYPTARHCIASDAASGAIADECQSRMSSKVRPRARSRSRRRRARHRG